MTLLAFAVAYLLHVPLMTLISMRTAQAERAAPVCRRRNAGNR